MRNFIAGFFSALFAVYVAIELFAAAKSVDCPIYSWSQHGGRAAARERANAAVQDLVCLWEKF